MSEAEKAINDDPTVKALKEQMGAQMVEDSIQPFNKLLTPTQELNKNMKGNIAGLMQQAQKMQQEMQKAQEELANLEVTGEAGGGMAKVTMNGKHAVRRIEIDPSLLDDREMLEDIVTAAVNDAVNRIAATTQDHMSDMTAGIHCPPV